MLFWRKREYTKLTFQDCCIQIETKTGKTPRSFVYLPFAAVFEFLVLYYIISIDVFY